MVRHYPLACVERVLDGSTLVCLIDLGFNTFATQRIKLFGIDVQPRQLEDGAVSWSQLSALCLGINVEIEVLGLDLEGDWLASVRRKSDGLDLAQEMIRLDAAKSA